MIMVIIKSINIMIKTIDYDIAAMIDDKLKQEAQLIVDATQDIITNSC